MSIEIENLLLIIGLVWIVGMLFRTLRLPMLLGELLAGLIFGPALLGWFQPTETVTVLAELGIFFLMLHAGLETSPKDLLKSSKTSFAMALGGIAGPLFLGMLVARHFDFTWVQAAFIGLGLSTTAISVTTKIFKDFKFNQSKIAHLVMGSAVISDIIAFLILSIIIGVVEGGGSIGWGEVAFLIGKVALFFFGVIFIGTKLIPYTSRIFSEKGYKAFTFTLIIALSFGFFAESIGLHYILGAYLAGLFVKEEIVHPEIFKKIEDRLFALSYSFLGPIFFVSLGFHVDFNIFKDPTFLPFLVLVIIAAIVGKFVGAGGAALLTGMSKKESTVIGVSMNGRGSVELIIAIIGLELSIINEQIFSALVFMAFFVTLATTIGLKYALRLLGQREFRNTE